VAFVVTRLRGASGTRWVGVDGKSGSGKTTLSARIAAALSSTTPEDRPGPAVVGIDDFARPGLWGWERERFIRQVRDPLMADSPASYQRWDFDADAGTEWLQVAPGGVVIVEGVSCTDVRLGVPWDVTLWVDAPAEERLRRALARDGEHLRARWLNEWIPMEDAYEREQRPQERVDLIVDGLAS
jgi:uridine kinase